MADWKQKCIETYKIDANRGDAHEIAIKNILKSLNDDQKEALIADGNVKAFWEKNGIDEPDDCGDIIGDLNSWEPEQREEFRKLITDGMD